MHVGCLFLTRCRASICHAPCEHGCPARGPAAPHYLRQLLPQVVVCHRCRPLLQVQCQAVAAQNVRQLQPGTGRGTDKECQWGRRRWWRAGAGGSMPLRAGAGC